MAAMTVTTKVTDLRTVFNEMKEVFFKAGELKATDFGSTALAMDIELPVLDDGVSFDTGSADVTKIKLTTQEVWTSKATKGDADISFNVPSIAGTINELLMNKSGNAIAAATGIDEGATYKGQGYKLAPKKVEGALLMRSEDRQTILCLPKVEMFANFVGADGDNPAYFKVSVTPNANSEGTEIFILWKDA